MLPLLPSRTIGNVGVSIGARQPSFAEHLSQHDAYFGIIHEQGMVRYINNHMQEEWLHKGSPQVNGVFEFVCNKQGFDKESFSQTTFCQKSIMLGRTEQNLKLKVFKHESDLAG